MQVNEWNKCYDEGWKDLIVPEAFSHPAKMSCGLLKRILDHAKGWLREGDVIVDPFGGIGSTGILGAYEGYQVVCCELEQKFVDLAEQSFELHKDAWVEFGNPFPIILQGDSRRLCKVVEKADCIVSSPPFQGAHQGGVDSSSLNKGACKRPWLDKATANNGYGQTPGQLGAMKPGKVDMVVSSPPYAETPVECTHRTSNKRGDKSNPNYRPSWKKKLKEGYDQTTRPYGQTSGNLGNLKSGDVDCVISSPPFEKQQTGGGIAAAQQNKSNYPIDKSFRSIGSKNQGYQAQGQTEGQLGQEQGDTFWQAAKTIVEQCHQILKPGGHAIWVVKSFVRKGKIVDFPGDWQRLCESVGFKTVCVHHAMLVKETSHKTLFGHTETKRKERKSFFRRLAESKGSPPIDYEVVLCMTKPTAVISSVKNK